MLKISKILCILLMFSVAHSAAATTLSSTERLNRFIIQGKASSANYQELQALHLQIIAARSVDEARKLALAPTDDAMKALHNANAMMPFNKDLRIAEQNLKAMQLNIEKADNQAQIADQFSGVMLAGLDNDHAAHLGIGKVGCDYSSGEVIAIVIGLILGIIPGLILMALLC